MTTTRARRTDPESSHRAAAILEASGDLARQQRGSLALVETWPGSNTRELSWVVYDALGDSPDARYHALARRLPELHKLGLVERGYLGDRRALRYWPAGQMPHEAEPEERRLTERELAAALLEAGAAPRLDWDRNGWWAQVGPLHRERDPCVCGPRPTVREALADLLARVEGGAAAAVAALEEDDDV